MGYPLTKISDHADVFNGKTPSKSEQREVGNPVLKIRDVDENGVFKGLFGSFVDADFYHRFAKKKIKQGDTLILNAAHNADYVGSKSFLAKSDVDGVIATGEWLTVRPNSTTLDASYAHFWLTSQQARKSIRELVKGIHLYPKDVARLEIPLPPLEEQKRIATILDQADDIRRKRQHAIERLNQLGQAIFYEMFGDLDANSHNFPIVALDKLIKVQGGYAFKSDVFEEEGAPVIRISNVDGVGVDLKKSVRIAAENVGKGRSFTISEGDLLIAMSGATTGKTGIVPKFSGTAYLNQRVGKYIVLDKKNLISNFLVNLVRSEFYQKRILEQAWGAAQPNVSSNQLVSFAIPLPPIGIQNRFSECMNALSDVKFASYGELSRSEALFDSLQHRAFAGEL